MTGRVTLLVIADCPNSTTAAAVLGDALASIDQPRDSFSTVVIQSAEDAAMRHFIGSPSIYVDGRDILPVPGAQAAVACRAYVHADGSRHAMPEKEALIRALSTVLHP